MTFQWKLFKVFSSKQDHLLLHVLPKMRTSTTTMMTNQNVIVKTFPFSSSFSIISLVVSSPKSFFSKSCLTKDFIIFVSCSRDRGRSRLGRTYVHRTHFRTIQNLHGGEDRPCGRKTDFVICRTNHEENDDEMLLRKLKVGLEHTPWSCIFSKIIPNHKSLIACHRGFQNEFLLVCPEKKNKKNRIRTGVENEF